MSQKLLQTIHSVKWENRITTRRNRKEQRDVSLDGKMIALVWHKLVKKMGFSKGIAGT